MLSCKPTSSGVSSYVLEPSRFLEPVTLMDEICRYWFRVVALPH
jgi:hypothetical protein